ncbi:MAG: hypothetical protein ACPGUV_05740 [Polyangiales bacterium]
MPAVERLGPEVRALIEKKQYFVVHAPRQTGKTTCLKDFAERLRCEGKYCALHFSCETGEARSDDLDMVQRSVVESIERAAKRQLPEALSPPDYRTLPSAVSLAMRKLLEGFVTFWRRHGEVLLRRMPYHEATPHLTLMAFLQRVVNGGGEVEREFAVGTGRADLRTRFETRVQDGVQVTVLWA